MQVAHIKKFLQTGQNYMNELSNCIHSNWNLLHIYSGEQQINGWFVGYIRVKEAVIQW